MVNQLGGLEVQFHVYGDVQPESLRQELIETVEGAKYWGDILAEALAPLLGNANIYTRLSTEKSQNQTV